MEFALNQEDVRQKWKNTVEENHRLRKALEMAHRESADLELKLRTARKLLDEEKGKRRLAEDQRNSLVIIFSLINELLTTTNITQFNKSMNRLLYCTSICLSFKF